MGTTTPVLSALLGLPFATFLLACGPSGGNPTTTTQGGCEGEGCSCAESSECGDGLVCEGGVCGTPTGTTSTEGTEGPSTSTGSSTSSSTQTSEGSSTGCDFVCVPDGGVCDGVPGPYSGAHCSLCDPFVQDCPDGQKCAAWDSSNGGAWDSTKCVDVMGTGQHGDPCTAEGGGSGVDDCAKGVMCWDLNEEGVGTCIELCTGSPEDPMCDPPGTTCVIGNDGVLNVCLPQCDPLLQDCPDGDLCIGEGEGFVCAWDASDGMAPAGTPCEFINVCNPGLFCASSQFYPDPNCVDSLGCCTQFCDLQNGNADCAGLLDGMAECVAWFEMGMAPPQFENVGGCGIPS